MRKVSTFEELLQAEKGEMVELVNKLVVDLDKEHWKDFEEASSSAHPVGTSVSLSFNFNRVTVVYNSSEADKNDEAAITIRCNKLSVTIIGLTILVYSAPGRATQLQKGLTPKTFHGLKIVQPLSLSLSYCTVKGAEGFGCVLEDSEIITVYLCEFSNNIYGGLAVNGVSSSGRITDCEFNENGLKDSTAYGYGVTLASSPGGKQNHNIDILDCRAVNNRRNGIDVHCGSNIEIRDNTVMIAGFIGIYAVNQNSASKFVSNVTIQKNTVIGAGYAAIGIGSAEELGSGVIVKPSELFLVADCILISGIQPAMSFSQAIPVTSHGILIYMTSHSPAPGRIVLRDSYLIGMKVYGILVSNANKEPKVDLPQIEELSIDNLKILNMAFPTAIAAICAGHQKRLMLSNNFIYGEGSYGIIAVGKNISDDFNTVLGNYKITAKSLTVQKEQQ